MVETYIPYITAAQVELVLKANWKRHAQLMYEGKRQSYTYPELVKVGKFGIYDIVVRASESNGTWKYDGGIQSGGSTNRQGGFNSVQAVIDWAIERATEEYIEFYEKNPDCK